MTIDSTPVLREHRKNLAKQIAMANYELLTDLVNKRIESGLTQLDVARLLRVSQQSISKFESLESDPRLSTITKYAMAINVLISHKVTEQPVPTILKTKSGNTRRVKEAV